MENHGILNWHGWSIVRKATMWSGFLLTGISLVAVNSAQSSEPTYNGKPLSEWLLELKKSPSSDEVLAGMRQQLDTEQVYQGKKKRDEDAIRRIGTNALPTLLDMLGAKDRNVKKVVSKLQNKELQEEYRSKDSNVEDLRSLAVDGFSILGTNAASAVPQITKLFHNLETSFQAARALTKVGPEGFSVLTNALSDKKATFRGTAIWVIGEEAPVDSKTAASLLVGCLKDPDVVNRGNAATFLAGKDPSAIPALIEMLDDDKNYITVKGAAQALSSFGSAAKSAAPKLLSIYTNHPDILVLGALRGIDQEAAAKAEAFLVNSGPLNAARFGYTTTLLPHGKELIAGGYIHTTIPTVSNRLLSSAELIDPVTGKWTETGQMNFARFGHTATLLNNGKVLVAGGSDRRGHALSSAELYDPTTGKWTETGSMNAVHHGHYATLQADGKVLIFSGGWDGVRIFNDGRNQELYDPATEKWTEVTKQ